MEPCIRRPAVPILGLPHTERLRGGLVPADGDGCGPRRDRCYLRGHPVMPCKRGGDRRPPGSPHLSAAIKDLLPRARSGDPYGQLALKQALAHLPVEEAFTQYQRLLAMPRTLELRHIEASSMQRIASTAARAYHEVGPSGQIFVNRAPGTVSSGRMEDLTCQTRKAFVACFADARVQGRSASIETETHVMFDFEDWERARTDDWLEQDPPAFRSQGEDIWYMRQRWGESDLHLPAAFMLTGSHTRAFGHWMWEYLPKYGAALLSGCLPRLPILIDADMPSTHRQALEFMMPAGSKMVGRRYRNDRTRRRTLVRPKSLLHAAALEGQRTLPP